MAAPDLDVIKDIPGYKVILKAVLKSQIQQLVEQLAATTDEESVILTASVADGTLSHLGSQSGKGFLEDHEDIKSQFLGFCLKKHHRDKQEKERLEAEAAMNQARLAAARHTSPHGPYMARSPRFTSPHGHGPVHPVALTRTPRGRGIRSPGNRHEPYPSVRPPRRTSTELSPAVVDSDVGQLIKVEPNIESNDNETSNQDSSQAYTSSNSKSDSGEREDDAKSESSNSTNPNESQGDGLGLDSDLSNIISGSSHTQGDNSGEIDTNVTVKMEAISESDMELEITGVEPGRPSLPQDNWDPNISMGMNFDPSQGASGNQADMTGQGYRWRNRMDAQDLEVSENVTIENTDDSQFEYAICDENVKKKDNQRRHLRKHNSTEKVMCDVCGVNFGRKDSLKVHYVNVHLKDDSSRATYLCSDCGKACKSKQDLLNHSRIHKDALVCEVCCKTFNRKDNLQRHLRMHEKLSKQCPVCKKYFKDINKHLTEKCTPQLNFECSCGKIFSAKRYLNEHVKRVHEKKYFACELCQKPFKTRSCRRNHMKKVHQHDLT